MGCHPRSQSIASCRPVILRTTTHAKHRFQAGNVLSGDALPVTDPRPETVEFYQVTGLKVAPPQTLQAPLPPWHGVAPALAVYRERGHRRLAARTFAAKCTSCIWGCRMPVEMIIDQWDTGRRRYRVETFCYGPRACPLYQAGPPLAVPGRRGMVYTEENWVDHDPTAHRRPDE